MNDYDFAVFTLILLAKHLEAWEPDGFTKATVVAFVRSCTEVVADVGRDPDSEEAYQQQLRFCREHNMICLEYYRRRGTGKRMTVVHPVAQDA